MSPLMLYYWGKCAKNLFLTQAARSRLCWRNFSRKKKKKKKPKTNWVISQNKQLVIACENSEHDESARNEDGVTEARKSRRRERKSQNPTSKQMFHAAAQKQLAVTEASCVTSPASICWKLDHSSIATALRVWIEARIQIQTLNIPRLFCTTLTRQPADVLEDGS